jgi:hypothetical protein
MQNPLESLAAVATILGAVISVLALFHSRDWLALTSLLFVSVTMLAGWYARRQRLRVNAASIVIEGHSIDSLNIANLRRRVDRTFVIQEAHHTARIEGENLEITWKYSGYCRAKREAAIEFSIDSDASTSFDSLKCVAYDLGHDPEMTHKIRPVLVGTEGISKKISVPFLEPLKANQSFGVILKCTLPRCVKAGFGYYTSTLSFAQDRVRRCVVHLIFVGVAPSWMRVYECTPEQPAVLVKTLPPFRQEPHQCEYVDVAADRQGQSARVYMFWRCSEGTDGA